MSITASIFSAFKIEVIRKEVSSQSPFLSIIVSGRVYEDAFKGPTTPLVKPPTPPNNPAKTSSFIIITSFEFGQQFFHLKHELSCSLERSACLLLLYCFSHIILES